MESSKHSMVKSPHLFSTCIMDVRNTLYAMIIAVHVQYSNKLLDNYDGQQWTLHAK